MASKFGFPGGIPERRVRPIWDAIDTRQFKNALKLSASLISRHPNSPYAFALKAHVLEKVGKCGEALSCCLNAKELLFNNGSILIDDLTLSTLQTVLQRLDRLDLATSCYEYSCSKHPCNLDLLMGLFNCYVHEYSFVKQQQAAVKMYKIIGEERFLLWAVCSIQLQVLCNSDEQKLLLLAEGLLKKHITAYSLHELEALLVYISILEQQAKFGDALEILSGKLGSLFTLEIDKLHIQGRLLAKSGDYVAAAIMYEKILEQCPDDWKSFIRYLDCLLEEDNIRNDDTHGIRSHSSACVGLKESHISDEVFDLQILRASTFAQRLQEEMTDDFSRCHYLATIEIQRRKHLYGKASYDDVIEALVQYFVRAGHLACFRHDAEMFIGVLNSEKKMELLMKLRENCDPCATLSLSMLGQSVTIFSVQELAGCMNGLSVIELEGCASQMVDMFCRSLPFSKNLDENENMYGEELLSMACSALVQLFWRTGQSGYFMEAILVLEFGLTVRKYVWKFKVLLLHLYSLMGAFSLAYDWYASLDVKNILMESLAHHILPQMLMSPLWDNLHNLLKDYLQFTDEYLREFPDLTFLAYCHRNYSKVCEFVQFKDRLQRSNQYLLAKVETHLLRLKRKANNVQDEEGILESMNYGVPFVDLSLKIRSKKLTFNEDLNSRPWWTPTPQKNYLLGPFEEISYYPREDTIREREECVRRHIERKSLLPRIIFLSIQSSSASLKDVDANNGSLPEFKFLLDRTARMLGCSLMEAIEMIMGVSSGIRSPQDFGSDVIDWINLTVFLNAWNLSSHEVAESEGCVWKMVITLLKKFITENITFSETRVFPWRPYLPALVQLVTEPLSWHTLVIQACLRSCSASGRKKKKGTFTDLSSTVLVNQMRDSVCSLCDMLQEVVDWVTGEISRDKNERVETILSVLQPSDCRTGTGPGRVVQIIDSCKLSMEEEEFGERIAVAFKTWSPFCVADRIVASDSFLLTQFLQICNDKMTCLQELKLQLTHL